MDFLSQRYALWGPLRMDPGAVAYINNVIKQAYQDPDCQKALAELYYAASWMDSVEYYKNCEKVQNNTTVYVNKLFFE